MLPGDQSPDVEATPCGQMVQIHTYRLHRVARGSKSRFRGYTVWPNGQDPYSEATLWSQRIKVQIQRQLRVAK